MRPQYYLRPREPAGYILEIPRTLRRQAGRARDVGSPVQVFQAYKIAEGEEILEIQIQYVATCDIYAQALANFVERNRDNSEIWSEGSRRKASYRFLSRKGQS